MKTVYLAGLIATEHPETFAWRQQADLLLRGKFQVLSPLRGKEQLYDKVLSTTTDGGLTSTKHTNRDIIMRDYQDVSRSDIILVNLEVYGSKRALLGTIYELAWAWDRKIPVVAICNSNNYLMRQHPFVEQTVCHYFESVEQACLFTIGYFGE